MLAEVLILRGAKNAPGRAPLFTYEAPEELAPSLQAGQLVTVPFSDRAAAGIVWALNAAGDVDLPDVPAPSTSVARDGRAAVQRSVFTAPHASCAHLLKPISALVLPHPVLTATQRALAEWIADTYAAPLSIAVRLFLPPGLLPSVRVMVHPAETTPESLPVSDIVPRDEAVVQALVRERGRLERRQVVEVLGKTRAQVAMQALLERGAIRLAVEVPEMFARARTERRVRLLATADKLEEWRAGARTTLDAIAVPGAQATSGRRARPTRAPVGGEINRQAEQVLRQLAVLDVLASPSRGTAEPDGGVWKIEELQRLTRATASSLAEMQAAGLITVEEAQVRYDPLAGRTIARTQPLALSPAQNDALRAITVALDETRRPAVFLLHGITGSGKTEVYLQALSAALARGRRGIVLVPEIALTPQAMARYAGRFPGRIALLHSGLSDAERLDEWRRIRAGEVDIVLGSRSALFAPVEQLGLIVVDEEHEAAYKQDRTPTYSARDAAVRLGALAGATVVLGSATPAVESYWRALHGEYTLLELRERAPILATPARLPEVTVVDLRAELRAGNTSILSAPLHAALQTTLERGEQAILFLNRRGTASSVICRECGYVVCCGRCDVSMTFHAGESALICHYCGRRQPAPTLCPVCRSSAIRYFGLGTERVESAVKRLFPAARVLRWDRDTARTREVHEDLLRAFTDRRADVLVGTQMIAKGLDLPAVTLVGVVSADVALFLPDFRASERAFQLLTQVAGRAGRGNRPGRVFVQTFNPDHFCIQAAARHDFAAFVAAELDARTRYGYPPLRRFVRLTYARADRYAAQVEATALAARMESAIAALGLAETDIVGPAPAFLERLRGRYRWQIILRSPDPRPLLAALLAEGLPRGWAIDVDPASTL
jgi:primosomal protein N' (replication factor Y)